MSISNIKHGDKVKIGNDGSTAGFVKYDVNLDDKETLKDAANAVLSANSSGNNYAYAFYYKNDTYIVKEATALGTYLTDSDHLVKLAGYHIDDLNPYFDTTTGELTL